MLLTMFSYKSNITDDNTNIKSEPDPISPLIDEFNRFWSLLRILQPWKGAYYEIFKQLELNSALKLKYLDNLEWQNILLNKSSNIKSNSCEF